MKTKTCVVISAILLVATIVFASLWYSVKNNKTDFKEMAQYEASTSYSSFVDFQSNSNESSYWQAVASFYSFEQSYYRYIEGANKSFNYIVSNEIYGYLLISPEKCQSHIEDVIEIMDLLSKNVEDENAYLKMSNLRNILDE